MVVIRHGKIVKLIKGVDSGYLKSVKSKTFRSLQ